MKVENITSSNGNKVANQFIIYTENGSVFQSYNSIIAKITDSKKDNSYYVCQIERSHSRKANIENNNGDSRGKCDFGLRSGQTI